MKKAISFILAALMLVSAVPISLATNDYSAGTKVEYVASGSESYTITVPALLAPGGSGTVTLSGTWADNRIVTVTADPTVTLKNSIKETDTKTLNVNFNGISEAGSNTGSQTFTEGISVDSIANALFGTWSGKFNYNVDIESESIATPLYFGQPYSATVSNQTITILFYEDGSAEMYLDGTYQGLMEAGSAVYENNTVVFDGMSATISGDKKQLDIGGGTALVLENNSIHYGKNYVFDDGEYEYTLTVYENLSAELSVAGNIIQSCPAGSVIIDGNIVTFEGMKGVLLAGGTMIASENMLFIAEVAPYILFGEIYSLENGENSAAIVFYEDGSSQYNEELLSGEFESCPAGTLKYIGNRVIISDGNMTVATVSEDGSELTIGNAVLKRSDYVPFVIDKQTISMVGYDENLTDFIVAEEFTKNNYKFRVVGIRTNTFADCLSMTNITIPDSVTYIGEYAFNNCPSLTNIVFGDGLTSLPKYLFLGEENVKSITIGSRVSSLYHETFTYLWNLESITVDADNQHYCSVDDVLYTKNMDTLISYPRSKADTSFTVPNNVITIGDWALSMCDNLISVNLPNGLTTIGDSGFSRMRNLKSVNIPASVTSIGTLCFFETDSLESITVDANNQYFCSVDGVLYSKDMGTLIKYPQKKARASFTTPSGVNTICEYALEDVRIDSLVLSNGLKYIDNHAFSGAFIDYTSIPESVISIDKTAFDNCNLESITVSANNPYYCSVDGVLYSKDMKTLIRYAGPDYASFTIPNTVTHIGDRAFENSGIVTLVIPDSVTDIGENIIFGGISLDAIYYTGTEEQWNNIKISPYNDILLNGLFDIPIYFNYVP